MNITPTSNSFKAGRNLVNNFKLSDGSVVRIIKNSNDQNKLHYLEAAIFKKGKDNKMYLENFVSTFNKPKGLNSSDKLDFAYKALKMTDDFEEHSIDFIEGAKLNTGKMDTKNFIMQLIAALV